MTVNGRLTAQSLLTAITVAALCVATGTVPAVADPSAGHPARSGITNVVVIYEENHSFDNLFGGWERSTGPAASPRSAPTAGAFRACPRPT